MITLILGGARSGKSTRARVLAEATGLHRVMIATADAGDEEMTVRIARHRAERDQSWQTVEEPQDLPQALQVHSKAGAVVVVDCLTLWLSNRMVAGHDGEADADGLCDALNKALGPVILVSNEVGLGLVPETPLGRAFRDAQGRLNQRVATVAHQVLFVAAGLPFTLKDGPEQNR